MTRRSGRAKSGDMLASECHRFRGKTRSEYGDDREKPLIRIATEINDRFCATDHIMFDKVNLPSAGIGRPTRSHSEPASYITATPNCDVSVRATVPREVEIVRCVSYEKGIRITRTTP